MKKILIVDDNEADQYLTKEVLKAYDVSFEVLCAYDGREALDLLEKEKHSDVTTILLDLNMPGMSGFEFLKTYDKMEHTAVVAVLTSSDQDNDKSSCSIYGFVRGFFTKPIALEDMQELDV